MTRKIKNSLLIIFAGLFVALMGLALFTPGYKTKANADDDIPTEEKTICYEIILFGKTTGSASVDPDKPIGEQIADKVSDFECEEGKVFTGYWSNSSTQITPYAIKNQTYKDLIKRLKLQGSDMGSEIMYNLELYPVFIDPNEEKTLTFVTFIEDFTVQNSTITCTGKWNEVMYPDLVSHLDTYRYSHHFGRSTTIAASMTESLPLQYFSGKTYFEVIYSGEARLNPDGDGHDFLILAREITRYSVTFMRNGKIITTRVVVKGESILSEDLKEDCEREGYNLLGYSLTENGEILYGADEDFTPEDNFTLYAVYEEIETPDDSGSIGDKINDVADNVSNWINDNTGLAFSSGGVIVLGIILAFILFSKRK